MQPDPFEPMSLGWICERVKPQVRLAFIGEGVAPTLCKYILWITIVTIILLVGNTLLVKLLALGITAISFFMGRWVCITLWVADGRSLVWFCNFILLFCFLVLFGTLCMSVHAVYWKLFGLPPQTPEANAFGPVFIVFGNAMLIGVIRGVWHHQARAMSRKT